MKTYTESELQELLSKFVVYLNKEYYSNGGALKSYRVIGQQRLTKPENIAKHFINNLPPLPKKEKLASLPTEETELSGKSESIGQLGDDVTSVRQDIIVPCDAPVDSSNSVEQFAETWSCNAHDNVNHRYDGMSYGCHLAMVVGFAKRFIYLIPEEHREIVIAACWAHDTIEDARKTYNDVKNALGASVAEIVYAVTNEKGRTRKERANGKYYEGIRMTKYAIFVKVCDRLANVQYSIYHRSSMIDVYKREQKEFAGSLYHIQYDVMFRELEQLLNSDKNV